MELTLPEYRERHIFVARLRLFVYLVFLGLYIYFYRNVLGQTSSILIIISGALLLTILSYIGLVRNRYLAWAMAAELVADLIGMAAVVYVTGGPYSDFFTIYVFYTFASGIFYHYRLALFIGSCCAASYSLFLWLCLTGIVQPLIIDWGESAPIAAHSPLSHDIFLLFFVGLVIYGVKIASYFNQRREQMLEARNKELTALARMSATIRSTIAFEEVLDRVLEGLLEGLDVTLALLLLFDEEQKLVRVVAPRNHPVVKRAEEIVGASLHSFQFPLDVTENAALRSLTHQQIIFRKNLSEITIGTKPLLDKKRRDQLKQELGLGKLVAVPLVAEHHVMGAIVGFTDAPYVEPQMVKTLEAFANQAALSTEAAILIQRLKEANRVKSEFLATMSHELRTPLTAIIGFSELLLEGVMGSLEEEQTDSLREILNNGASLLDMINNLLDMAKVEAGKMTLEKQKFDLSDLLQRLKQTISSLIQKKNQNLTLVLPSAPLLLNADEKRIQQVFLNLLSNAIKFTPEGGKINVKLTQGSDGERIIEVTDTGIGMRQEDLGKVFEMFQQADSSVTRKHGGTGLGLALAKQFVELHGGKIWAESELDRGTKFTVVLPA